MKYKTIYRPIRPGTGADLRYTGDARSDTDEDQCKKFSRKRAIQNGVAEIVNQGSRATLLTRTEATKKMIATKNLTGRSFGAIDQKEKNTDGNPKEIKIPTQMVSSETLPPYFLSVLAS